MPLYEYECDNCHEHFEVIEKFSDQPLTVHAKCGGGPVRRLISVSALKFKGSGWYVNDYAKGDSLPNKSQASDGSSSDGKKSSDDSKKSSDDSKKSADSSKSTDSSSTPSTSSSPSASTSDKT
jgi:putative FmdB family regulatory protein